MGGGKLKNERSEWGTKLLTSCQLDPGWYAVAIKSNTTPTGSNDPPLLSKYAVVQIDKRSVIEKPIASVLIASESNVGLSSFPPVQISLYSKQMLQCNVAARGCYAIAR